MARAGTDLSIKKDLEKAEAAEANRRIIKKKDPSNTEKAKDELEAEGKSVLVEKTNDMNADKISGKGSLKVRFEIKSHGAKSNRSFSDKKDLSASAKMPKG